MMNNQKVLNLLGLAQRAGKLKTGEEQVVSTIQNSQAKIVFVASDASENTKKKIQDKSSYYAVHLNTHFTTQELSHALGKPRKVVAVLDNGFAKKMIELLDNE
jgi:ribosomal protein L7Ae-like RNA K-turn-binding protein